MKTKMVATRLGDLTAVSAGYATASPDLFPHMQNLLLNAGVGGEATNEVVKMLAGLLIGILSKIIYGYIDKRFPIAKKERQEPIVKLNGNEPEPVKNNENEKEISK